MDFYLNVNQGVSVIFGKYDRSLSLHNSGHFQIGEHQKNKVKGVYTSKSKKRFSSIIKNWISVLESVELNKKKAYKGINNQLRFVTLTLPSEQIHSDKFIRRFLLNRFLRDIKEKFGVLSYIYCSEAQKNGNIHFHIVIDKFINHKQIKEIWNKVLNAHGYIDVFEKKHGHREPNSTDIHSFKKVNSIAAYLIKYFTKDENRRLIEGRLWGSSENLKKLTHYSTIVTGVEAELFNTIKETNACKWFSKDYFTIYSGLKFKDFEELNVVIYKDLISFYGSQEYLLKKQKNDKTERIKIDGNNETNRTNQDINGLEGETSSERIAKNSRKVKNNTNEFNGMAGSMRDKLIEMFENEVDEATIKIRNKRKAENDTQMKMNLTDPIKPKHYLH